MEWTPVCSPHHTRVIQVFSYFSTLPHTHHTHPSLKPATFMAFPTIFTISLSFHIHSFSMKLYSLISLPFILFISKITNSTSPLLKIIKIQHLNHVELLQIGVFSINKNLNFLVLINCTGHVKKEEEEEESAVTFNNLHEGEFKTLQGFINTRISPPHSPLPSHIHVINPL